LKYQDQAGQLDCNIQITCTAGEEVVVMGGPSKATECRPCNEDQFDHDERATSDCEDKKVCNTHQSLQPGFAEYESDFGSSIEDRVCSKVRFCEDKKEFEVQAPTITSDRECEEYLSCDFYNLQDETGTEYESFSGSGNENKKCSPLKFCKGAAPYEVILPTKFSDRICSPYLDKFANGTVLPYHRVDIAGDSGADEEDDDGERMNDGVTTACQYVATSVSGAMLRCRRLNGAPSWVLTIHSVALMTSQGTLSSRTSTAHRPD
jgi:hypothetical protein